MDERPLWAREQCPAVAVIDGAEHRCYLREGHESYYDGGVIADPDHCARIFWPAS